MLVKKDTQNFKNRQYFKNINNYFVHFYERIDILKCFYTKNKIILSTKKPYLHIVNKVIQTYIFNIIPSKPNIDLILILFPSLPLTFLG